MVSDDYIKRTFPLGKLTILAGKPYVGKTGFVLSVARMLNKRRSLSFAERRWFKGH